MTPRTDPVVASRRTEFVAGMKATFPLIVGAIPFGIIFGALAVTSGLTPAAAAAMSAFVFAGSGQFVAAGLFAGGTGIAVIVLTTFIVNLRHSLYSATLAPHMKHLPHRWLLPLGFWLTDETFLVVVRRYSQPDSSPHKHWFYLGSALFMYVNWQLCTLVGIWAGRSIPNPLAWGLDFALPVTFLGMLVPSLRGRSVLASAGVAAIAIMALRDLPGQLGLLLAVVLAVIAGSVAESMQNRFSPQSGDATQPQDL